MGDLQDSVRTRVDVYSAAFGFSDLDETQVTAVLDVPSSEVRVSVTSYPLFSNLTGFGLLSTITVSRMAIFRCERAPSC